MISLFFYGTLKRGHSNYNRFCRGAVRVEKAVVRGRLYDLPTGYPALVVCGKDVYLTGTADPIHDAAEQNRLDRGEVHLPGKPHVHGELFVFDDPERRLPALDLLEGFNAGATSLYRRVLVPARASSGITLAWAYTAETEPEGMYLPDGIWPPPTSC